MAKLLDDRLLVSPITVQFQARPAVTYVVKPPLDHIERRHLFGDEQDPLPLAHGPGDEIDDGLRLSGTGWPLDHHRVTVKRVQNGERLRAIGIDNLDDVAILKLIVEQTFFAVVGRRRLKSALPK